MTYKYYSIMRPIGIGTLPRDRERVSVLNYPEGKKEVKAADGRSIFAWGEVEYSEPLTAQEMYQYELKGDFDYPPYKHVGYWMNDTNGIEIIMIEGRFFALHGWNGNDYGHCWECKSRFDVKGDEEYTLTPIYRYETDAGRAEMDAMYDMEEDSAEWNRMVDYLNEIVSYTVSAK